MMLSELLSNIQKIGVFNAFWRCMYTYKFETNNLYLSPAWKKIFGTWTWREHFFSWWGFFLTVSLGMPPAAASSPRAEQTPPHELQLGTGPDCHGCGLHYWEQSILLRRCHQHWSNHLLLVLKIIYVVNFFLDSPELFFTLKILKFFVIPDYRGYSFFLF